jgi:hypothetical protein
MQNNYNQKAPGGGETMEDELCTKAGYPSWSVTLEQQTANPYRQAYDPEFSSTLGVDALDRTRVAPRWRRLTGGIGDYYKTLNSLKTTGITRVRAATPKFNQIQHDTGYTVSDIRKRAMYGY